MAGEENQQEAVQKSAETRRREASEGGEGSGETEKCTALILVDREAEQDAWEWAANQNEYTFKGDSRRRSPIGFYRKPTVPDIQDLTADESGTPSERRMNRTKRYSGANETMSDDLRALLERVRDRELRKELKDKGIHFLGPM